MPKKFGCVNEPSGSKTPVYVSGTAANCPHASESYRPPPLNPATPGRNGTAAAGSMPGIALRIAVLAAARERNVGVMAHLSCL